MAHPKITGKRIEGKTGERKEKRGKRGKDRRTRKG